MDHVSTKKKLSVSLKNRAFAVQLAGLLMQLWKLWQTPKPRSRIEDNRTRSYYELITRTLATCPRKMDPQPRCCGFLWLRFTPCHSVLPSVMGLFKCAHQSTAQPSCLTRAMRTLHCRLSPTPAMCPKPVFQDGSSARAPHIFECHRWCPEDWRVHVMKNFR